LHSGEKNDAAKARQSRIAAGFIALLRAFDRHSLPVC